MVLNLLHDVTCLLNYVSCRFAAVHALGKFSSNFLILFYCVPQSSNLGPLLFNTMDSQKVPGMVVLQW
jgi:hypothetical protein